MLNLQRHQTQVHTLLPQGPLLSRGLKMTSERVDSLKVAEGRVAFDVVLLLEAVKLGWVHVHSCQNLKINDEKG